MEKDIPELPAINYLSALTATIEVVVFAWKIGRGDPQSIELMSGKLSLFGSLPGHSGLERGPWAAVPAIKVSASQLLDRASPGHCRASR